MTDPDFIDTSTTLLNACRMLSEELTFRGDGGMRLIQHFADAIMAHCVAEARKPDPAICHLPMPIWSSNGDEVIGEDDTKECGCAMPCAYHGEIKRRSTETRAALEEVIGSADAHMRAVDAAREVLQGSSQPALDPVSKAGEAGSTPARAANIAARERMQRAIDNHRVNFPRDKGKFYPECYELEDAAEALLALPSEPMSPPHLFVDGAGFPSSRCCRCAVVYKEAHILPCTKETLAMVVEKHAAPAQPGDVRERLAELEHEQWIAWSKNIAERETLSPQRLARWKLLWCDYSKLTEKEKDQDRKWADKALCIVELRSAPPSQPAPAQPGEAARAWRERGADIVSRCLVGGGTAYKQLHDVFDEAVAAWTAAEQRADAEKQITRQLLIRIDGLKAELIEARNERETVTINRNDLRVRIDRLASERDAAVKRAEAAEEQSDASVAECDALRARLDALVAAWDTYMQSHEPVRWATWLKATEEARK